MVKQNYGRIINTTSASGLYGNFGQSNYAAQKLAVVGLAYTLAQEGKKKGIQVNCIAPSAGSRMTETVMPAEIVSALKPEFVTPVVAWLAHESCTESGQVLEAGGGWVSKVKWQHAKGKHFDVQHGGLTPEDVAGASAELNDFSDGGGGYPNWGNPEELVSSNGVMNAIGNLMRVGLVEEPKAKL
jgi:NAD(P)-dependent dehydrogenase (short-subunit alcohol dehydrogenase family)